MVEEKLPADLFASVEDDRLGKFVRASVDRNTTKALLVVGSEGYNYAEPHVSGNGREWSVSQIDNLLVSVQMSGVVVLRAESPYAAASRLVSYWEYTGKEEHSSLTKVVRPEISQNYMDVEKREAVRLLMCISGLGEKRAKAVLEYHGQLRQALASSLVWDNVPGIGKGLARRATDFLDRKYE